VVLQGFLVRGVLLGLLGFQSSVFASIPTRQAEQKKLDRYLQDGVFRGGEAGRAFSLRDISAASLKASGVASSSGERLTFEFGDALGEPLLSRPGYFQVNVDSKKNRVVLDFRQVAGTKLDQNALRDRLAKSKFVKSSEMTFDPEDSTLSIVLNLKGKAQVEVIELPKEPRGGRVALDFRDDIREGGKR
jgi:hypothetical protein